MIDELWPPNPNELDNAALTSNLSFIGPTSTLISWIGGITLRVNDNKSSKGECLLEN